MQPQLVQQQQANAGATANANQSVSVAATPITGGTEGTAGRMTTVLGSRADVAPFVGKPGYNTFTGEGIAPEDLDRANAECLNQAIRRGDDILLKTDPAAHAEFLQGLPNQPQSAYLNLELPMLNQYDGVNVIQDYNPPAAAK